METIHGAESWLLEGSAVRVHVTRDGGMVAPVEFRLGDRTVSPYALAPWKPDEVDDALPVLLKNLRGDFFCLPFGPQKEGDPHGAPANARWNLVEKGESSLVLGLDAADSGARIEKRLSLRPGQTAIYHEHRISGLSGHWSFGNHPVLDVSGAGQGGARVSVSPFRWASVYEGVFSAPERNESQALKPGARFKDLSEVPLMDGGSTDLTRYPDRVGNDDLVMMVNEPASDEQPFAWSAVVMDGYVWFSLKNSDDFPATLFWMSNGGRGDAPWDGRHFGRIGIEEVCSHFCDDVTRSREEALPGIPTVREFKPEETTSLFIVQAVAAVPAGFGSVTSIAPAGDGLVRITDDSGASVESSVDWSHVL